MIWQKMVRNNQGSYRASEIAKNLDKIFFWGEEISMYQPICVEVDSFRCEFTAGHIFRLVSKFESLAGIGKNAHTHASGLGIIDNASAHGKVGILVEIGMNHTCSRLDDRHLGIVAHEVNEPSAATWDAHIYITYSR